MRTNIDIIMKCPQNSEDKTILKQNILEPERQEHGGWNIPRTIRLDINNRVQKSVMY